MRATLSVFLLLSAAVACPAGCRPARSHGSLTEISGTVTVDGRPLDNGVISFVTPTTGDVQVFEVHAGRFAGQARVGERRIEVRRLVAAAPGPAATELPSPSGPVLVNDLPDHLNAMSTITASVTADGPNTFAFDLRSASSRP